MIAGQPRHDVTMLLTGTADAVTCGIAVACTQAATRADGGLRIREGQVLEEEPDIARFRQLLGQRRREVLELLRQTESDRAPVELDQTRLGRLSRMDAMQVQAMAQAATRRREQELGRLEAALKRCDDETYGECLACGEFIAIARLELDPAATLCIACARK